MSKMHDFGSWAPEVIKAPAPDHHIEYVSDLAVEVPNGFHIQRDARGSADGVIIGAQVETTIVRDRRFHSASKALARLNCQSRYYEVL